MAPKKGPKKVVEKLDLAAVVNCGESGYIFTFPDEHAELLAAGYIQVNPEIVDEHGAIATAPTQMGIDFIKAQQGGQGPDGKIMSKNVESEFIIEDAIEIPAGKRGGGKPNIYPFDKLEVGQSFFVPTTEKRPEPAKSLASTVSSANNRFATPDPSGETRTVSRGPNKGNLVPKMVYSRKFIIKAVEGGARIWRTV